MSHKQDHPHPIFRPSHEIAGVYWFSWTCSVCGYVSYAHHLARASAYDHWRRFHTCP